MSDPSVVERLDSLLQKERAALLNGDFDQLAALFEEKQRLAGELAAEPLDVAMLDRLRRGLARNDVLFDQALLALRKIAARIGDLDRIRRATDTYDAKGRKCTIEAPKDRALVRRA